MTENYKIRRLFTRLVLHGGDMYLRAQWVESSENGNQSQVVVGFHRVDPNRHKACGTNLNPIGSPAIHSQFFNYTLRGPVKWK